MQRMALSSGAEIAAFIANNAAVSLAENATLPPDQRDWLPVQAFVRTAADDANVRQITIIDGAGVIRASTALTDIGRPYRASPAPDVIARRGGVTVLAAAGRAYRFVRPVLYAGRPVGAVDVEVSASDLAAASTLSRVLLGFLALVTLGAVMTVSYVTAQTVAQPLRRLRAALTEAADGDLEFRISHARRDEFGELFDAFNRLAGRLQGRADTAEMDPLVAPGPPAQAGLAWAKAAVDVDRTQIDVAFAPARPEPVRLMRRLRDLRRA
jgi:serine/threonine-protein kinase